MSPRRRARDVRIQAGRWKGRRLEVPESARPTSGRARLALFSVLGSRVQGARVLDLYAGTGSLGLEAVSRGAARAVLVEIDAAPLARTLGRLGVSPKEARLLDGNVAEAVEKLSRGGERFDIIFADPPYGSTGGDLDRVAGLLAEGGTLVMQRDSGSPPAAFRGLRLVGSRAYGRNVFFFFGML